MTRRYRRGPVSPLLLFLGAALLSALLAAGVLTFRFGLHWLLAYALAINLITLAAYGYDKSASRRTWLRVPERVLHLLALAGGTPAAFAAQRLFRHKTIKAPFRLQSTLIAAAQVLLLVAWVWYRW